MEDVLAVYMLLCAIPIAHWFASTRPQSDSLP